MKKEQSFSVKVDAATYGRVKRIAKREGRLMQTVMHRAVRDYDERAKVEAAA